MLGIEQNVIGEGRELRQSIRGYKEEELMDRLLQMRKRGAATAKLARSSIEGLQMLITNRKPSNRFLPLLVDLRNIYGQYNLAIAQYVILSRSSLGRANGRNDGLKLRAIAMGPALSHGQNVLKANKRMEWEMHMGDRPPKIFSSFSGNQNI